MKWILRVFLALVGIVVALLMIGWLLPRDHVVSRTGMYQQSPEKIWAAITDVDAMPSWREGLKGVKRLPERNGLPAHVESTGAGELEMQTEEMVPPRKLVNRIANTNLPFGGTWTFEIAPAAGGATLRITENGYVTNPLFRFVSRFVLGYTSEIDTYLRSLAKKFGEPPQIGD
jgi:uncharacterized protein YndB with AHSA1/START domain